MVRDTFTATQTDLNVSITDSGDSSETDIGEPRQRRSPGVQLQVFTTLAVTSTPSASAKVGQTYTYTLHPEAPSIPRQDSST